MLSLANSPVGALAEYRPARSRFIDRHDRRHLAVPLKKVRPRISPRPDLTGARGTSARAAISSYVVATTAAVKLLAAAPQDHLVSAPACRMGERLVFPRRKTGVPRILPCQRRT